MIKHVAKKSGPHATASPRSSPFNKQHSPSTGQQSKPRQKVVKKVSRKKVAKNGAKPSGAPKPSTKPAQGATVKLPSQKPKKVKIVRRKKKPTPLTASHIGTATAAASTPTKSHPNIKGLATLGGATAVAASTSTAMATSNHQQQPPVASSPPVVNLAPPPPPPQQLPTVSSAPVSNVDAHSAFSAAVSDAFANQHGAADVTASIPTSPPQPHVFQPQTQPPRLVPQIPAPNQPPVPTTIEPTVTSSPIIQVTQPPPLDATAVAATEVQEPLVTSTEAPRYCCRYAQPDVTSTPIPLAAPSTSIPLAMTNTVTPTTVTPMQTIPETTTTSLLDTTQAPVVEEKVVNRADASGLVSGTKAEDAGVRPPALSKELMEWLARGRIRERTESMEEQNELQKSRYEMMSLRQSGFSKQVQLANRLSGSVMRDMADNESSELRIESDVSTLSWNCYHLIHMHIF